MFSIVRLIYSTNAYLLFVYAQLPAPDNNNNPFGYKLSWAPRGVLLASRNDAHFLRDGKEVSIPGAVLFDNYEVSICTHVFKKNSSMFTYKHAQVHSQHTPARLMALSCVGPILIVYISPILNLIAHTHT